ncbi:hypothetical protein J7T55_006503 [Diaporthe amygdali]|uniref:uncharacterized protein n=1 Tax=Phomopsis amygdali TaxID=1214568 RepID=UPI0022FDBA77|nr:uncharacterized protein J7T55_006503 [Diaporthe amygdali]KAJ0125159.1 hypothetical protein J7T55_006503 [Diaporthe amygdali]
MHVDISLQYCIVQSQNLAVLAAYEAAIGPALRALLNIGLQTSVRANEPKTRGGLPKKKKNSKDNRDPSKGKVAATRTLPQVSSHRRRSRDSFAQSTSENRNDFQGQNSDPAVLSTPFQPEQRRNSPIQNSDAFERMERQALRRRKVEALESLAHTAALFLAEFLDFRKAQQVPAATRSPPAGSEQHQVGPGAGVAYAAAAAGMAANVFQPLSQELERSGYNSSGSEMAQHSSSHDTSDDEDLPFRISIEPKVDVDMDDSESDGSSSETSASFRDGVEANDDEPEVKVEEK